MNFSGLKQASRQCLKDCRVSPVRLTLLFLLCFYAVTIPCDCISFLLENRLNLVSGLEAAASRNRYYLWASAITVLVNGALLLWDAGYTMFTLNLSRSRSVNFSQFASGFQLFGKVLLLTLQEIILVSLWSMLFILPGIAAAYRYRMALYVLLDHPELSSSEALQVSKELTYGHKMELFLLDISFFWYYFLTSVTAIPMTLYSYGYLSLTGWSGFLIPYLGSVLLGLLVDVPCKAYVQTTYAHAYNWLVALDRARRQEAGSFRTWHTNP